MTATTTSPRQSLASLTLSEKRQLIAQRLQARKAREIAEAREMQQLYAELFPNSSIGPMATDEELELALRQSADICSAGFVPNMQGIFAELGEASGRVKRWAKVNAGAHIPKKLKEVLPQLRNTALYQELETGGMMTTLDQAEMCQHSPATFAKVAARHLGLVRTQKMFARELKQSREDAAATKLRVLALEAKGTQEEAWVAVAVALRVDGATWDAITTAVGKRRADVMSAVKAKMQLVGADGGAGARGSQE